MVGCDSLKVVILVRIQASQHFDSLRSLSVGPISIRSERGEVS